jgi:SAM-dependent methyltransferase
MSHKQQWDFCNGVKEKHPSYFKNAKVLDIGSFDVNGNEEFLFENCEFDGLDLGPGPGVTIVCPAQDYNAPDEHYDTIISCECWEHNPFYAQSIINALRMLKRNGLFLFTCATTGRPVHGVASLEKASKSKNLSWKTMPNVSRLEWDNEYYKNLTEDDIRKIVDIEKSFSSFAFSVNKEHCDLYFWGIKSNAETCLYS